MDGGEWKEVFHLVVLILLHGARLGVDRATVVAGLHVYACVGGEIGEETGRMSN